MGAILQKIGLSVVDAIEGRANVMVQLSPYLLGALALFLLGWILAEIAARLVLSLGPKIRLEWVSEKIGLKRFLERRKIRLSTTALAAHGLKAYLIFLFFIEATKIARFTQIADFLSTIYSYIPSILIALFIMLVGIEIGHTLEIVISTSLTFAKARTADALGLAAKYTVITFAILAALAQLQIAEILIQILFVGFVGMLMIAGGLAFGLGGKEVVKELLEDMKKEIRLQEKEGRSIVD